MSEEMKEPMQTDNDRKIEEAAASTTEMMADYEDHFDDANPWNLSQNIWKKNSSSCKSRRRCKWRSNRDDRRIRDLFFKFLNFPFPISKIWKLIF